MKLDTVIIDRAEARQSYADYMKVAKRERDDETRREMEALAHAYRMAAKKDISLIALSPTIQRGGTSVKQLESGFGSNLSTLNYMLPNVAACRASAQFCFTMGVEPDGEVSFVDRLRFSPNYRSGFVYARTQFELPDGFKRGKPVGNWDRAAWSAQVPIVPPKHRPRGSLANHLVLWEVEDWTWKTSPKAPVDPALLRHVAGDVYAVLAQWNLTDLERLVLSGRTLS